MQDFLVDDSKDEFQLWIDLPLQQVVLVGELLFETLSVFEQHALDEDVHQLNVEVAREKGLAP